jgi:hypothetical protein
VEPGRSARRKATDSCVALKPNDVDAVR